MDGVRREGGFMKPSSRLPRTPSRLSDSIHHQLNLYALAAGAAGVGVLALAQPAEAKIIYTPAHITIGPHFTYQLDLNRDGIYDFWIFNLSATTTPWWDYVRAKPLNSGNGIWVQGARGTFAAALPAGVRVGADKARFAGGTPLMAIGGYPGSSWTSSGPWKNVSNRYLGLKFLIKRKPHYGWARLSVRIVKPYVYAALTGYAYETLRTSPSSRARRRDLV